MRIIPEPSLSALTTLRIGGKALAGIILEDRDDYFSLGEKLRELGGQPFWLGKGSNILARDGLHPCALIQQADSGEPLIIAEQGETVFVKAGAGMPLPRLLRFCLKHGLSGLENLCGIPGSVGGAVAMNAGSFGTETADALTGVEIWADKDFALLSRKDMTAGYRSLKLPCPYCGSLLVNAFFALTHKRNGDIFNRMNHNFLTKKFRQPVEAKSAGCVFKNPPGNISAGQLLDEAGFRGRKLGGMAFSSKHANFLINEKNGSAAAALDLLEMAKEAILERHGIKLEMEVRVFPGLRI